MCIYCKVNSKTRNALHTAEVTVRDFPGTTGAFRLLHVNAFENELKLSFAY